MPQMTFKIERFTAVDNVIVLRVSGRMHMECVKTIEELIERERSRVAFDLSEVTIASRDAAIFLAVSERKGIELRNCPAFLREWVAKEQLCISP
jgi:hypothetical protein